MLEYGPPPGGAGAGAAWRAVSWALSAAASRREAAVAMASWAAPAASAA